MQREGYIMIDHRASPGLPEDLARRHGFDPAQVGEGKLFEAAMLTCSHCKISKLKNPDRTRERGHCFKCHHYVCDTCAAMMNLPDYDHMPFEKVVDVTCEAAVKGLTLGNPLSSHLGSPSKLLNP
jgi:hypothetical protein